MKIVKNLKSNAAGHIECLTFVGGEWLSHIMTQDSKYKIHKDSKWKDIKPCSQDEKDTYVIELANAAILAELAALDATPRLLEDALLGDKDAMKKLTKMRAQKAKLREKLV